MAQDAAVDKELPLAGVIICFTSISQEQRSNLVSIASQMGAIDQVHLTAEVTHLIVGDINTPKYKYVAKERNDVVVLRVEWVEAVRSSWILGGDTDIPALEAEYRLPPLFGLSVCLTGFEDLRIRKKLEQAVLANGAEFRRDLSKSVSHLVAHTAEGQKYKFAMLWGIKIVTQKWLEDTIQRGMALDESLYDPLLPPDQIGVGAWNRSIQNPAEKRARPRELGGPQRARKLRRVASVKLGDHAEGIWSGLVSKPDEISQYEGSQKLTINPRPALLEAKSFASETTLPERRESAAPEVQFAAFQTSGHEQQPKRGIWYKCRFYISSFTAKKAQILESYLLAHDATVSPSLDDLLKSNDGDRTFMLVPFDLPQQNVNSQDEEDELEIVTDMWIERCLHGQTFVPPEAHITSTPFPKFPISAFQGMKICSTGFSGIDLLHLSKLVKLLGATYDEYFTPKASVLICHSSNPSSEKLNHAFEWQIPTVLSDWLWISVQTAEKKPFQPYLIMDKRQVTSKLAQAVTTGKIEKPPDNPPPHSRGYTEPNISKNYRQDSQRNGTDQEIEQAHGEPATLREVSANSPKKFPGSPTPAKATAHPVPPLTLPRQDTIHESANGGSMKSPLDLAIDELIKNKRNRTQSSSNTEKNPSTRRKRQLFGRAHSNASTLTGNDLRRGMSRASSIDTLNEDGCGSVIDGFESQSTKSYTNGVSFKSMPTKSNGNPRNHIDEGGEGSEVEAQQLLERRIALFQGASSYGDFAQNRAIEEEPLTSTQLGYDDPDAIAMREMITKQDPNDKGQPQGGPIARAGSKLVIGSINDDNNGWSNRRRTRSHRMRGGIPDST
ncbi:hypothetical protein FQN57_001259 [Myotisia sp. PD_48]|nr:hypothetical protein FQN57_001259 [Myotisia sp. PD_48]